MQDRFKFRAVLKTDRFVIIVPTESVLENYYLINADIAQKIFEAKYPNNRFFPEFFEIIIEQYSFYSNLLLTKDFRNLMQCSGLKDKNSKLIYEGDIVMVNDNYPGFSILSKYYKSSKFIVEYFQPRACYQLKSVGLKGDSGKDIYESMGLYTSFLWNPETKFEDNILQGLEVIGNIYENPKLLKGGKNDD